MPKIRLIGVLALISSTLLLQVGPVQSQVPAVDNREPDILLKAEVVPDIRYVQAQLIYILRVYSRESIDCGRFYEPKHEPFDCESSELHMNHAEVQKRGDVKQYQESGYNVYEQRYVIFPQNSGRLEIPSITFAGQISAAFFLDLKTIKQHFPARQLDIQPKPPDFPDNERWLPAQDLLLNEAWTLNSSHFQPGEPISLTLTMQVKGLTDEQLPKLEKLLPQHFDGFHVDPQPGQPPKNRFDKDDWLISEKQQSIDFVPKKPGHYSLPEIKIPWWDTINQQLSYAVLPARSIQVSAVTDNGWQTFMVDRIQTNLWFLVSFGLAVAWLITLVAWWRQRQQRPVSNSPTTDSSQKHQLLRATRKALKQACELNDPQPAKQALLEWAAIRWDDIPMYNLGNIAAQLTDTEAKAQLTELDRVLYASEAKAWNGKKFWQIMSKNLVNKPSTRKREVSPLPTLYP
jgi:hypothetical protein